MSHQRAPKVAAGEPHEDAWLARVGRFPLNRIEDLVHAQHNISFYRLQLRLVSNLRIGTSGWNYPAGRGTWNGIFYPAAAKGRRGKGDARPKFDELAYYAEHFDTVEVNTTFYGQPKADVAQTWADRTPSGFEFSLKLYRKLTHADIPGVPRLDLRNHRRIPPGGRTARARRQDWGTARAVSSKFQAKRRVSGLSRCTPAGVPRLPDCRRAATPELERRFQLDPVAVERARRGADADRRAEVQAVDPPEPAAQYLRLLLHAPARPERRRNGGSTTSPRTDTTTCIRQTS